MKSKLFSELYEPGDDFKKDLAAFAAATDDQVDALRAWLADVAGRWHEHTAEDERRLHTAMGLDIPAAQTMASFVVWLKEQIDTHGDNLDHIVGDLGEIGGLDEGTLERFRQHFPALVEAAGPLAESERDLEFMGAVLPRLTAVVAVADLRLRVEREFEPDDEKVEDYSPKVTALLAVGLCRVTVRTGTETRIVSFQVTPRALDRMISRLVALQKEMLLLSDVATDIPLPSSGTGEKADG